jgi:hypothetical protein
MDFDATSWNGTGSIPNNGSVGGNFTQDGRPTRALAAGVNGAFFDGTDAFVGPATPAGITGTGDRTVEVWVYQGTVRAEETLVAWGKRGGPDGTNNSVNWGSNGTFGAFGGWGAGPDQGYGALQPAAGMWHHIAYTADGANKIFYVDGVLATSEPNNAPALNTVAGLNILIGAQQNGAAAPGATVIDADNKLFGGVVGRVRVHDGVLSGADILNNFNAEKATFQLAARPTAALTAAPTHRWSFNEVAGTSFADSGTAGSAGTAATLRGAGAVLNGSGVRLPGGASSTQAYVDLPNGVASGKDLSAGGYASVTYEVWLTANSNQNWSRVVDFGNSTGGEITSPGGSFNGANYMALTNNFGTGTDMRMERIGGINGTRDAVGATILNSEQHIVITYDAADGMWKWYQNGKLMDGFDSSAPGLIDDVNNWLGRSNYAGDANTDGTYNEFRIYNYPLTDAQIQRNFLDGPNVLSLVPEASTASLSLLALGLLTRRRRK